jgi:uncharacterized protein (TIGR00369 family)
LKPISAKVRTDPWEPLYSRKTQRSVIIGFRATAAHTNSRGFVHGGLITALADNAMGLSCVQCLDNPVAGLVTVSLSVDFLSTARLGQWVEIDTGFVKTGRSISFAQAFVTADGNPVARASASFSAQTRVTPDQPA